MKNKSHARKAAAAVFDLPPPPLQESLIVAVVSVVVIKDTISSGMRAVGLALTLLLAAGVALDIGVVVRACSNTALRNTGSTLRQGSSIHACMAVPLVLAAALRVASTSTGNAALAPALAPGLASPCYFASGFSCALIFAVGRLWEQLRRGLNVRFDAKDPTPFVFIVSAAVATAVMSRGPMGDVCGGGLLGDGLCGSAKDVLVAVTCDAILRAGVAALPMARTFSASEAAIVAQGVALATVAAARATVAASSERCSADEEQPCGQVSAVAACGLAGACWLVTAALAVDAAYAESSRGRGPLPWLPASRVAGVYGTMAAAGLAVVVWLWVVLRRSPLLWLLAFLAEAPAEALGPRHGPGATALVPSFHRAATLAAWGACIAAFVHAVAFTATAPASGTVGEHSARCALPKTVARKLFHGLVVVLFSPVAASDPCLLALAFAVALALLALLEVCRAAGGARGLPPLGEPLRRYYGRFVDGREGAREGAREGSSEGSRGSPDAGAPQRAPQLVLTPLYLLAGCAVPHWAALAMAVGAGGGTGGTSGTSGTSGASGAMGRQPAELVVRLAGVVALGVGDAAAAVVGRRVGRTQWPGGGQRTVEGSAAALAAMLIAATAAGSAAAPGSQGPIAVAAALLPALVPALALVALVEAYATAIDNLVLPLYATALLTVALL